MLGRLRIMSTIALSFSLLAKAFRVGAEDQLYIIDCYA